MNAYNIISIVCQVYHSGLYIIGNIMYDSSRSVLPVYMIKMTYLKSCVGLEKRIGSYSQWKICGLFDGNIFVIDKYIPLKLMKYSTYFCKYSTYFCPRRSSQFIKCHVKRHVLSDTTYCSRMKLIFDSVYSTIWLTFVHNLPF